MNTQQHPLTRASRYLWPALLGIARVTVARHEQGEECGLCPCYKPGRCSRWRWARLMVVDPEMLAAERQAAR
ncbi:hypothetical protein OG792_34075 [Micromonospora sp. NBC_01699]|uniref:hypothetical protein n=1 Tax=Micromonospora sp. NBC_01699 TaxID=2975984 RepID=UPI002E28F802|nr:hypothetical protein [Micromonospora sp. NBC_01699]